MLKPPTCRPCPLFNKSIGFSTQEGEGRSGVLLIGEALGHEESIDGLPFRPRAQAGSLLEKVIKQELGLTRDDFKIGNILQCQPPNNLLINQWYERGSIDSCSVHRDSFIDAFVLNIQRIGLRQPVIVALGATAFETLTGETLRIVDDDIAGHVFWYRRKVRVPQQKVLTWDETKALGIDPVGDDTDSFIGNSRVQRYETLLFNGQPIPVIPTYHPAFIKRGNNYLTPLLAYDIGRAVKIAKGDWVSPAEYSKKKNYRIVGYDEAESFYNKVKDGQRLVLAYDIETNESGRVSEDQRDDLTSTEITQIQFATDKYSAIVFPNFDGTYLSIGKKILELGNVKSNHNVWNFDNPRLKAKGVRLDESKIHDTMWMFKQWSPKLPRGLQRVSSLAGFPFAWKHLFGVDPTEYGGADVCSIHFILEWLPKLMNAKTYEHNYYDETTNVVSKRKTSVWQGYKSHVYNLHPVLQDASDNGLPVNDKRRWELDVLLAKKFEEINKEVQAKIPDEIKNVKPKTKVKGNWNRDGVLIPFEVSDIGYIREPRKELEALRERYESALARHSANRSNNPSDSNSPQSKFISYTSFIYKVEGFVQREVEGFNRKTGESLGRMVRWIKVQPFKSSFDQMCRYILWKREDLYKQAQAFKGSNGRWDRDEKGYSKGEALLELSKIYEIPKDAKGKETTRKDEVEILFDKTGDEVLQLNLEMRSITTNRRNYIPNWTPNPNTGAVHTRWNFSPPQGQLISYRPNVLNVSKHTEYGQMFRRIIEAPEGYEFLELDHKSFHVGTMGYIANDPEYLRFSQLDPHSIFCSRITTMFGITPISMTMEDGEILDRCKWIKKKFKELAEQTGKAWSDMRQSQAKPSVLGNQLGLGPRKLYWQNRRSIPSEDKAKEYQAELNSMFDKVKKCKDETKIIADKQQYLMNEFGYIQWFYDVLNRVFDKRHNRWVQKDGDEAREPIAFRVQGTAFGMIKDELFRILKRVRELDVPLKYRVFRMSVHDSLVFLQRIEDRERLLPIYLEEMNKPCRMLVNDATGPQGLKISVEWSYGRNLQNYHKDRNPEGMREG